MHSCEQTTEVDIVWMTHPTEFKSRMIRLALRAPYSHVGIIGAATDGRRYLVHAIGKGVCYQTPQSYLANGEKILFKKKVKLNCSTELLTGFALGESGKEYSDLQCVLIALHLRFLVFTNNGAKRICSEFVASVLENFSEYKMPQPLDYVTPVDLFNILQPSAVE